MNSPFLELENISKTFPGVKAFEILPGLDRYEARLAADAPGDWGLRVEGWSDPYGTLRIPVGRGPGRRRLCVRDWPPDEKTAGIAQAKSGG